MGHTNSTANLSLPQFIGTDKPTWLGDINSAFSDIDAYAGTNDATVSGAVSDAASAVSQAASAVSTANAANTTAGNASTAATNAVGTANNAMSLVNQTNTKIGTLANLNTTDKTSIVNAINEVNDIATGSDTVSVSTDGVKTRSQIFDDLYALIDPSKITFKSFLTGDSAAGSAVYHVTNISGSVYGFAQIGLSASDLVSVSVGIKASGSTYYTSTGTTVTDSSSYVMTAGSTFTIHY